MNENEVKLSVIVTVLGNCETLDSCLDGIRVQTLEDFEILCVADSASKVASEIVEAWEQKDSRVRFVAVERESAGCALNAGLKAAKGEYVAFLHPGDSVLPRMYETLAALADEEGLDFVQCDGENMSVKGDKLRVSSHASHYGHAFCPAEEKGFAAFSHRVANGLYRRSFLLAQGISFLELAGAAWPESGFWLQVYMKAEKGHLVRESLCVLEDKQPADALSVFKEYDAVGRELRREAGLYDRFRFAYAVACYYDCRETIPRLDLVSGEKFLLAMAEYFRELHDDGMIDYYMLSREEHSFLAKLLSDPRKVSAELYAEKDSLGMAYVFPYHLFREGDKVVIYGAGEEGLTFYRQALHDGFVKIVGLVDLQNYGECLDGVTVGAVSELKSMDYDYVLISDYRQKESEKIRRLLVEHGVKNLAIRWDGGVYTRDAFYKNYYWKLLPMLNPECQPHWKFLEWYWTRMKGSVRHIFPYHLFSRGERVVIYGAGDIGREFYRQSQEFDYLKVVAIVDRNPGGIDVPSIPVAPVGALKQLDYDAVLISVHGRETASEIRNQLVRMGIPADKMRWDGTSYFREEFYMHYFERLDVLHEMAGSKL